MKRYVHEVIGLPMLAREDTYFIAVFSGQIIVPRDPAFIPRFLLTNQTSRLVIFVFRAKIAKHRYSVCLINLIYCAHALIIQPWAQDYSSVKVQSSLDSNIRSRDRIYFVNKEFVIIYWASFSNFNILALVKFFLFAKLP